MPGDDEGDVLAPLHAVVPVRSLSGGKQRLGGALDAEEREELILGMLRHTLRALHDWPPAVAIHLVTPDRALLGAVAGPRIVPHLQPGEGLNEGIALARTRAIATGARSLLVLPIDLPMLSVEALDGLALAADASVAAAGGGPVVVVAPADARTGTNALFLRPPDVIDPCFGPGSLEAHVRAAAAAGAAVQLVHDPDLGFDLDTPDDLERVDPGRLRELVALGQDAIGVGEARGG